MSVSIIIPNFNGSLLLPKTFPAVLQAVLFYKTKTKDKVEIIFVDDASLDRSVELIDTFVKEGEAHDIRVIKVIHKRNIGFSTSVNDGARHARNEILVLLNTDVLPQENFLIPLLSHFQDEKIFAVGCLNKSVERNKEVFRGRGIGKWQRGFLVHSAGAIDKTNTLWVSGGSGAFRNSFWGKLGGFNSIYDPFYWEDVDFSYRALKSGYNIVFEPKSIVTHYHEKGAIQTHYSAFEVKTIAYRNQILFTWVNATDLTILISHVVWLPYHIFMALLRRDKAFYYGFFKALFKLPETIRSARKQQTLFVKSDKDIISNFTS